MVGDGVVVREAEAVGDIMVADEAAAGAGSADRKLPATATPPATAARATITTAAASGQRRRALLSVDSSSS
ncbi:hypothetical protein PJ267_06345 [Arthrobacter sp. OVS8]|nr:hypothetical protein PJ267_06345 [Arthrobacter sp. OVS8]